MQNRLAGATFLQLPMNGTTPGTPHLVNMAARTGVSVTWLLRGIGPKSEAQLAQLSATKPTAVGGLEGAAEAFQAALAEHLAALEGLSPEEVERWLPSAKHILAAETRLCRERVQFYRGLERSTKARVDGRKVGPRATFSHHGMTGLEDLIQELEEDIGLAAD